MAELLKCAILTARVSRTERDTEKRRVQNSLERLNRVKEHCENRDYSSAIDEIERDFDSIPGN